MGTVHENIVNVPLLPRSMVLGINALLGKLAQKLFSKSGVKKEIVYSRLSTLCRLRSGKTNGSRVSKEVRFILSEMYNKA